jgi:hypothetical protein
MAYTWELSIRCIETSEMKAECIGTKLENLSASRYNSDVLCPTTASVFSIRESGLLTNSYKYRSDLPHSLLGCSLVEIDRRYRGAYCLHHHRRGGGTTHA